MATCITGMAGLLKHKVKPISSTLDFILEQSWHPSNAGCHRRLFRWNNLAYIKQQEQLLGDTRQQTSTTFLRNLFIISICSTLRYCDQSSTLFSPLHLIAWSACINFTVITAASPADCKASHQNTWRIIFLVQDKKLLEDIFLRAHCKHENNSLSLQSPPAVLIFSHSTMSHQLLIEAPAWRTAWSVGAACWGRDPASRTALLASAAS